MSDNIAFCKVNIAPLRREAKDSSEMVSQLLFGELLEILAIKKPWARIKSLEDNYEGFVDVKQIENISEIEAEQWKSNRKILQEEIIKIREGSYEISITRGAFIGKEPKFNIGYLPFELLTELKTNFENSPFQQAFKYLGVPYLWGGRSAFGIDCSALMQVCFAMTNIKLPRDAYQQAEIGNNLDYGNIQQNDLAYFHNDHGKIIHVGILDNDLSIIHASGMVRKDILTKEGIFNSETKILTHKLSFIKRLE